MTTVFAEANPSAASAESAVINGQFPHSTLPSNFENTPATGEQLRWHVLQTKSRQEKALAEGLSARGMRCFLPIATVNRAYGNRRAKVDLPLFPGYLFLHGSLEHVYLADRTKRVARIIPVFNQEKLAEELRRNIELALRGVERDGNGKFDPFPYLKRGIRVEVSGGALKGVRGIIESRLKRDRLVLQVDVLGQATSVEVDGALLVPLAPESDLGSGA